VLNKLVVSEEHALIIWDWLQNRGGILSWSCLNLADCGPDRWQTPADHPNAKPHWSAGDPRTVTDPNDVEVITLEEFKRFHVAVRIASQRMSYKLTDGATRNVRKACAAAGEGSTYYFDYGTQEAVIMRRKEVVPLVDFMRRNHATN
jgi:hypothetical protein